MPNPAGRPRSNEATGVRGPVTEAAVAGDQLSLLTAMRDRLAMQIDDPQTHARDLAALTKRLMEILADIEAMERGGESSADGPDEEAYS